MRRVTFKLSIPIWEKIVRDAKEKDILPSEMIRRLLEWAYEILEWEEGDKEEGRE